MRNWKKLVYGLSLLGTTILPACTGLPLTSLRDAAIAGTATFVETTVFDILSALLGVTGTT